MLSVMVVIVVVCVGCEICCCYAWNDGGDLLSLRKGMVVCMWEVAE